jgi:hypothetical protein
MTSVEMVTRENLIEVRATDLTHMETGKTGAPTLGTDRIIDAIVSDGFSLSKKCVKPLFDHGVHASHVELVTIVSIDDKG